ncbi:hypothetical protein PAPYR_6514 [Paratrimastix pyriformis]|uniref:SET domain-containing protein n=1 Tax=Paratrimastix pyriformis TaxID=342808 RepID=A0ABQ8UF31_9EUKA|nr:hypothetical protein PAPYR_6514 [Paratrimastix pyriformis]
MPTSMATHRPDVPKSISISISLPPPPMCTLANVARHPQAHYGPTQHLIRTWDGMAAPPDVWPFPDLAPPAPWGPEDVAVLCAALPLTRDLCMVALMVGRPCYQVYAFYTHHSRLRYEPLALSPTPSPEPDDAAAVATPPGSPSPRGHQGGGAGGDDDGDGDMEGEADVGSSPGSARPGSAAPPPPRRPSPHGSHGVPIVIDDDNDNEGADADANEAAGLQVAVQLAVPKAPAPPKATGDSASSSSSSSESDADAVEESPWLRAVYRPLPTIDTRRLNPVICKKLIPPTTHPTYPTDVSIPPRLIPPTTHPTYPTGVSIPPRVDPADPIGCSHPPKCGINPSGTTAPLITWVTGGCCSGGGDRYPGCACRGKCGPDCLCRGLLGAECDPDTCKGCYNCYTGRHCSNMHVQANEGKPVYVKPSPIAGAGLGLFAGAPIKRGEYLIEYTGEVIEASEGYRRASFDQLRKLTYCFEASGAEWIDSTRLGGVARYINCARDPMAVRGGGEADSTGAGSTTHRRSRGTPKAPLPNLKATIIAIDGEAHIRLHAIRDIRQNEEVGSRPPPSYPSPPIPITALAAIMADLKHTRNWDAGDWNKDLFFDYGGEYGLDLEEDPATPKKKEKQPTSRKHPAKPAKASSTPAATATASTAASTQKTHEAPTPTAKKRTNSATGPSRPSTAAPPRRSSTSPPAVTERKPGAGSQTTTTTRRLLISDDDDDEDQYEYASLSLPRRVQDDDNEEDDGTVGAADTVTGVAHGPLTLDLAAADE